MSSSDAGALSQRDFDREMRLVRDDMGRDRDARIAELERFRNDLKICAGIDLADVAKMDDFRDGMKYSIARIRRMKAIEAKSPLQRASVVLTAMGGAVVAIVTLWPIVKNVMEILLAGKH